MLELLKLWRGWQLIPVLLTLLLADANENKPSGCCSMSQWCPLNSLRAFSIKPTNVVDRVIKLNVKIVRRISALPSGVSPTIRLLVFVKFFLPQFHLKYLNSRFSGCGFNIFLHYRCTYILYIVLAVLFHFRYYYYLTILLLFYKSTSS